MKKLKNYLFTVIISFLSGLIASLLVLQFYPQITGNSSGTSAISSLTFNNETTTTKAVKAVQNAVVSVINYQSDFNNQMTIAGEGSGVIYKKDGSNAYLVTNTHVIERAQQLEIMLADGQKVIGELIGSDVFSDLAVIRIPSDKVSTVATFADSTKLNVGEKAIAIGSPLGSQYANSVTEGIVSSLSRTVTSKNENGETISTNAIQTDAAINPGNSGGALVNIQGQVIGINSSKIASSGASLASTGVSVEGMGFAIPANDVVSIINQLEENGKVVRPALGITMANFSDLSTQSLSQLDISQIMSGVLVIGVHENMPANGKLQTGDIITKIDDQTISSTSDLQSVLYKHQTGDTITVTFQRAGKEMTEKIKLTSTTEQLTN